MKTSSLTFLSLIFGVFLACEPSTEIAPNASGLQNGPNAFSHSMDAAGKDLSEKNAALATLRRVTAKYHDVDKTIEDGFVQVGACQENPNGPGGFGIPFLNQDRLDGTINIEEPEALFYEPQKNGKLRLIGVEIAIPIALWEGEEPPSMFGHEFHRIDEEGIYCLHIWVGKHNPDGIIAFWHSDVSCEFEE